MKTDDLTQVMAGEVAKAAIRVDGKGMRVR
jgi:hypothetical protein